MLLESVGVVGIAIAEDNAGLLHPFRTLRIMSEATDREIYAEAEA